MLQVLRVFFVGLQGAWNMARLRWASRQSVGVVLGCGPGSAPVSGWCVLEHLPRLLPSELPVDLRPLLVGRTVPSRGFPLQHVQTRNPARAQTLSREEAEFDFCLIEP